MKEKIQKYLQERRKLHDTALTPKKIVDLPAVRVVDLPAVRIIDLPAVRKMALAPKTV